MARPPPHPPFVMSKYISKAELDADAHSYYRGECHRLTAELSRVSAKPLLDRIDPEDTANHDKPLWCVYGPNCFPTVFCCLVHMDPGLPPELPPEPVIWGYSVYEGEPGFRTLGLSLREFPVRHEDPLFFATIDGALEHLRSITTVVA